MKRRTLMKVVGITALLPTSLFAASAPKEKMATLKTADGRSLDLFVYLPAKRKRGTILFSHGFGSAPRHFLAFISAWSKAGYEIHAPLHADSREHPDKSNFNPTTNWYTRIEDVRATVAQFEGPYFAAGHSFGGLTALVLGGSQATRPTGITSPFIQTLAQAVIALSPPGALPGLVSEADYAHLECPLLLQTGTLDVVPMGPDPESWQTHLTPYNAAPTTGENHAVILQGVDHYFGGLICDPTRTSTDQQVQLAYIVQTTCLFLERQRTKKSSHFPTLPFVELMHK